MSAEDMTVDTALDIARDPGCVTPTRVHYALRVLAARVAELEAQQAEPAGTEWGVRHRGSSVHGPHDESEARRFAARADYELHSPHGSRSVAGGDVSAVWWFAIGVGWCVVSVPVALWLGRVLRARNGQHPAVTR